MALLQCEHVCVCVCACVCVCVCVCVHRTQPLRIFVVHALSSLALWWADLPDLSMRPIIFVYVRYAISLSYGSLYAHVMCTFANCTRSLALLLFSVPVLLVLQLLRLLLLTWLSLGPLSLLSCIGWHGRSACHGAAAIGRAAPGGFPSSSGGQARCVACATRCIAGCGGCCGRGCDGR